MNETSNICNYRVRKTVGKLFFVEEESVQNSATITLVCAKSHSKPSAFSYVPGSRKASVCPPSKPSVEALFSMSSPRLPPGAVCRTTRAPTSKEGLTSNSLREERSSGARAPPVPGVASMMHSSLARPRGMA